MFPGSVSTAVLTGSPVSRYDHPVPRRYKTVPPLTSRLLLPVDFSRSSRASLSWLGEVGRIPDVIVLHVFTKQQQGDFDRVDGSLRQIVDILKQK
jgi:hypothetical protein